MGKLLEPWKWYFDRGASGPCGVAEDATTVVWWPCDRAAGCISYDIASSEDIYLCHKYTNRGKYGVVGRNDYDLVAEIPAYVEV